MIIVVVIENNQFIFWLGSRPISFFYCLLFLTISDVVNRFKKVSPKTNSDASVARRTDIDFEILLLQLIYRL